LNLVIIDEPANLTKFNGLPHNSCPVIHSAEAGYKAIMQLHKEMKRCLKLKEDNPEEFDRLPTKVCFIDECVSFVSGAGSKEKSQLLAKAISLLLRMGRQAKIFLILATPNPSFDEMMCDLTPITSRMAFKVGKPQYSTTVLGLGGAEKLMGNGDLYFVSQKHTGLMYLKGAYITPDEITKVCDHFRTKWEGTAWDETYKFHIDTAYLQTDEKDIDDELTITPVAMAQDSDEKLFVKIIIWALGRKTVSGNAIDLTFNTGARQATRFLEKVYKSGIVGDAKVKLGRKVIPNALEDLSPEIKNLLERYGYTAEDINEAFDIHRVNSKAAHTMLNENL
jgi:S-DNA-T family DNA segregation ATPase FtsK/SpoIIIE